MPNATDIIKLIELNEIKYFSIATTEGDNAKVFDMNDDETIEQAKSRFLDVMKFYPGGRFIFKGKKSKTDTRGGFRYEFSNQPEAVAGIGSAQQPVINGIPEDKVNAMIASALKEAEREREFKTLVERNKELEREIKEKDTAFNRIITRMEPALVPLISGFISKVFPTAPAVALGGIERQQETIIPDQEIIEQQLEKTETDMERIEELTEEMSKRIEAAIEKLANVEPQFIELLEGVAEMAVNADPMFDMAKKFILK